MEAHQLPKDCYPPTDSDDSDFEVLGSDSGNGEHSREQELLDLEEVRSQLLASASIDNALEVTSDAMLSAMTLQSLPLMPKEPQMNDSMMSSASASSTAVSTKLLLDLQEKVHDLKQENIQLKTTLEQQNIVSKTHSDMLTTWKEDVLRVHESHKQKFGKMKMLIDQLRKENKQLKEMLTSNSAEPDANLLSNLESLEMTQKFENLQIDYEKQLHQAKKELLFTKFQLEQINTKYNDLCVESQKSKDELVKLKERMIFSRLAQGKSISDQDAVDEFIAANDGEYHKIIEQLNSEKQINEKLLQDLKADHANEMKNLEEKLQLEICALQQQLAENQQQVQTDMLLQQQNTEDDLKSVTKELGHSKEVCEQQMLRINDLNAKLADLSNKHDLKCKDVTYVVEELRVTAGKNRDLEERLADYKTQIADKDEEYRRMEVEIVLAIKEDLQKEYNARERQLLETRNQETAEVQRLRIQLSEAQNALVELKEAKRVVETEAAKNRVAIDELYKEYQAARCDQDKLLALEEQLKVYRKDYETQRENKRLATEELNQVSHDLQNVQVRNRELVMEIEALRGTRQELPHPSAPETSSSSPPPTRYSCPLCSSSFRSPEQVQEHVDQCITDATAN